MTRPLFYRSGRPTRARAASDDLRERLKKLNEARAEVFGNIETRLLATARVTTEHNCVPRDLVAIGDRFLFGYNVQFGLKTDIRLGDVFSVYRFADRQFHNEPLDLIRDDRFESDFHDLYRFYKGTAFARFFRDGPMLHMVFRVGKSIGDVKSFKWRIGPDSLEYLDNRSEHEVRDPDQHEFRWIRTTRDQTLDDAEVAYAVIGQSVLLKVKPYHEQRTRYLVFNGKIGKAMRLDEIEHACVMLPGDHGLIFPRRILSANR